MWLDCKALVLVGNLTASLAAGFRAEGIQSPPCLCRFIHCVKTESHIQISDAIFQGVQNDFKDFMPMCARTEAPLRIVSVLLLFQTTATNIVRSDAKLGVFANVGKFFFPFLHILLIRPSSRTA